MIAIIIGTRAQLIKMAPVMLEMERRRLEYSLTMTGQHAVTMPELLSEFSIKTNPVYLYRGPEITGVLQMAAWFVGCMWRMITNKRRYMGLRGAAHDLIIVHGDTFSTLLGAIVGWIIRVKVAHVESGLRSHNVFHPFPEELTRLAIFRLASISFCPGEWACSNINDYKTVRINTKSNTLRDALSIALSANMGRSEEKKYDKYGVCSIHRFENIFNNKRLKKIISMILLASESHELIFVLHPATKKRLVRSGMIHLLENNKRIHLVDRMGYINFVKLISDSSFVITDGGGNQEELSYLNIPTLLMRTATERIEGIGSTATLCDYNADIMLDFIKRIGSRGSHALRLDTNMPTKIIVDYISEYSILH